MMVNSCIVMNYELLKLFFTDDVHRIKNPYSGIILMKLHSFVNFCIRDLC